MKERTGKRIRLRIGHKIGLLAMALLLLTAGAVVWLYDRGGTGLLVEHAIDDLAQSIGHESRHLQNHLETLRSDVVFLARMPPLQGIVRALRGNANYDPVDQSTLGQWVSRLHSIAKNFLRSKPSYRQVRLIDREGEELVRVERLDGLLVVTPPERLQDRSMRPYIQAALRLQAGAVQLSDIRLKRDQGEVLHPFRETIRAATPIHDAASGQVFGVLVVDSELGDDFDYIQRTIRAAEREVYITNEYGDFLLHPDPEKEYGFDLGHQYRAQEAFPRVSRLYLPENRAEQIVFRQRKGETDDLVLFRKVHFDESHKERFIGVGITVPYASIVSAQRGLFKQTSAMALVLIALGAVMMLLATQAMVRPLSRIGQAITTFSQGRHDFSLLPLERQDEIGNLARSFNALARQVQESQDSLRRLNQELEKRVEERTRALRDAEERQRTILETAVDGIITIDRNGIVQTFNRAAEDIFQYHADEVVGHNIRMLMPEPYASEHDGYLRRYLETGEARVIGIGREVEGRRRDGTTFPLDLAVNRMELHGELYFTGIVRDITDRKQMERMKNEFISTVSHELRTPLTSIRGALGLLRGGAMGTLPEQVENMLSIASNNTERLLLLINDILDIQKIESGKMDFHFERVHLPPVLTRAVEDNAGYARQYGVRFVVEPFADEDVHVHADRERLMQVLGNLLSNAAKFSPEGGEVRVGLEAGVDRVRITVADQGPGIPEDFRVKIFDKFTQADSSDTRTKGGTGLGLSISRLIVEQHGGRIGFDSEEGVGTTFHVELARLGAKVD